MSPPLLLRCRPSRVLLAGALGLHLLAALALFLADLPSPVRWTGLSILAVSAAFHLRRQETPELRLEPDGVLLWREADGEWQPAAVLPQSAVSPWLIVLRYRREGERRTRSLVFLPDSLPADDLRRLRVWLRWRAAIGIPPEPAAAPSAIPPTDRHG